MKVLFVSNFLNHHQLFLCQEFQKKSNIDFSFIATEAIPQERIDLGYEDMNNKFDFVIKAYGEYYNFEKIKGLINNSDVVIYGDAPKELLEERLCDDNKITFRYSERLFKSGRYHLLSPRIIKQRIKNKRKKYSRKSYLLAASSYAGKDYNLINLYNNKVLKWGYFPDVKDYNVDEIISNKKNIILWVGRFIKFKHPEKMIKLAKYLKNKGYKFEIVMIGIGPLLEKMKKLSKKEKVEDYISFLGSMSNDKVINYMKQSSIFVFSSDYGEGWGAVLNEAMNGCCGIVATKKAGATNYLIKDKENGFIYRTDYELYKNVELLLNNAFLRNKLGKKAYGALKKNWNASSAVKNLIRQINLIEKEGELDYTFKEGPASIDSKLL